MLSSLVFVVDVVEEVMVELDVIIYHLDELKQIVYAVKQSLRIKMVRLLSQNEDFSD